VRALVTGAAGQLGVELLRTAPAKLSAVGLTRAECDITDDAQLEAALNLHRPDIVINAAAYTAVDDAERTTDLANAVNAKGARNVAEAAVRHGARVIHISTDYVFDGNSREPYRPDDRPNPINVYGESKLAGEKEVHRTSPDALIIRSSWLYASHGKNFLTTILAALRKSRPLRVVGDQTGVPTAARGLAATIWQCAQRPELRGIQHWVDGGTASWYDFALAIREAALGQGLLTEPTPIDCISSAEYQSAARRPPYAVLDASGLAVALGQTQRQWASWVAETVGECA
jgi:dTDP-4-dehydrorhamnose reductase